MKKTVMTMLIVSMCAISFVGCGKKSSGEEEIKTAGTFAEEKDTQEVQEESYSEFHAGTSQSDATLIPLGTKITGTIEGYEKAWLAFTTGEGQGATYNITFVLTKANGDLWGELYDKSGNILGDKTASSNGTAATISTDQLEPNTTYYILLDSSASERLYYTLIVKEPNGTDSIENQKNLDIEGNLQDGEIIPGTSQNDAALVPLGTKVFGTVSRNNSNAWFAFTTGENAGDTYNITFVNETVDTYPINGLLCDEYGTEIDDVWAGDEGRAATISTDQLDVNTSYYIRVSPNNGCTVDYSVIVKNPDSETTAYRTVGNFSEARGASQNGEIYAGSNQNEAALIPLGIKVSGTISESSQHAWFAFTTGENRNTTYNVTYTFSSPDGDYRYFDLLDEYGESVSSGGSNANGEANVITTNQLEANTTYYIQFETLTSDPCDYSLIVETPEDKTLLKVENPLVFEVPFEINDTQIQFVINKAEFINEAKAKEELRPVAEAILEHPEHSILIVGTTATDGTQESCVDLSNRRAQAVKDLLVNTYEVPESQLQIIGLGYKLDPFERGKDRDSKGNFVESEGRKNRRVVILDIDDPIAQELLKK